MVFTSRLFSAHFPPKNVKVDQPSPNIHEEREQTFVRAWNFGVILKPLIFRKYGPLGFGRMHSAPLKSHHKTKLAFKTQGYARTFAWRETRAVSIFYSAFEVIQNCARFSPSEILSPVKTHTTQKFAQKYCLFYMGKQRFIMK